MAQKGRKYKLLANSEWHATNAEKEQKKEAEILASDGYPLLKNTPPSYMSNYAKTELKRILPALQLLPIRSLDRAMIEQYCVWYGEFKLINKQLDNVDFDERMKLLGTMDKISKNIRSAASELGLTVDSRIRMVMPKEEKKEKSLSDMFG